MDRREALKKIGLSFGVVITTPLLLHRCTNVSTTYFFNEIEVQLLSDTADVIIPGTKELPKASDVGVAQYIDHYILDMVESEEQDRLKMFIKRFLTAIGPDKPIEFWVEQTLMASSDRKDQWSNEINNFSSEEAHNAAEILTEEAAVYALLTNLKSLMIRAYRGSEYVGEQILAYDPVPGRQIGCIDLQEATGGRIWSL